MSRPKLLPAPDHVLKKAAFAERPGRVPRGYFDALLPVTKKLLDRGLSMIQVADWLIEHDVLPREKRLRFAASMRVRFTRFRRVQAGSGTVTWLGELGMDTAHAVLDGTVHALCGARSSLWLRAESGQRHCPVCTGYINTRKS
jgi:hypothetical protein